MPNQRKEAVEGGGIEVLAESTQHHPPLFVTHDLLLLDWRMLMTNTPSLMNCFNQVLACHGALSIIGLHEKETVHLHISEIICHCHRRYNVLLNISCILCVSV